MNSKLKIHNQKKRLIGIIDVYTFATQSRARAAGDNAWNTGPSVTALPGGRIISANRNSKAIGINTTIRIKEAEALIKLHPNKKLQIFKLPVYPTGKPDQTSLRQTADEILHQILEIIRFAFDKEPQVEWVPLDEIYIDLTDQVDYFLGQGLQLCWNALVVPWDMSIDDEDEVGFYENVVHSPDEAVKFAKYPNKYPFAKAKGEAASRGEMLGCIYWPPVTKHEYRKALGMKLMHKIIGFITRQTGIHCTGGVGANKMMAKIACSITPPGTIMYLSKDQLKKPEYAEKVTIKKLARIPPSQRTKLKKHGFVNALNVQTSTIDELQKLGFKKSEAKLIKCVAKGYDDRPVSKKHFPKNINCARNFYYRPLKTNYNVRFQLFFLLEEFHDRLEEQSKWTKPRIPQKCQLSVSYAWNIGKTIEFPSNEINGTLFTYLFNQIDYKHHVTKLKITGVGLTETQTGRNRYTEGEIELKFWGLGVRTLYQRIQLVSRPGSSDVDQFLNALGNRVNRENKTVTLTPETYLSIPKWIRELMPPLRHVYS